MQQQQQQCPISVVVVGTDCETPDISASVMSLLPPSSYSSSSYSPPASPSASSSSSNASASVLLPLFDSHHDAYPSSLQCPRWLEDSPLAKMFRYCFLRPVLSFSLLTVAVFAVKLVSSYLSSQSIAVVPFPLASTSAPKRLSTTSATESKFFFRDDGTFTIVQFTDVHYKDGSGFDQDAASGLSKILTIENPDLVVYTGDFIHGDVLETRSEISAAIQQVFNVTAAMNIPFAVAFGNHDDFEGHSVLSKVEIFNEIKRQFPSSLFVGERGPEDIDGVGNYFLPILSTNKTNGNSNNDGTSAVLSFLDSGCIVNADGVDDWIKSNQVAWFNHTVTQQYPSFPIYVFFHIPLQEFHVDRYVGQFNEAISSQGQNTGLFEKMKLLGNIKGVVAGHDHTNDFDAEVDGIRLMYGRVGGWPDNNRFSLKHYFQRGARVIMLTNSGSQFRTWIRLFDGSYVDQFETPTLSSLIRKFMAKLFV